jgi:erythronate-4-phosphate dehydrogenase
MNIVADDNMPGVEELFGVYGDIKRINGRQMCRADVASANLLLVRSVTKVNRELLDTSAVQFVASATIGTDHVDLDYLQERGIGFAHAPGCNADAVVQYDLSVFCRLMPDWRELSVGIVGCGNVGGRLYRILKALGVACQVYDPFLHADSNPDLVEYGDVLKANILCFHTPLTRHGPHPTEHLMGRQQLAELAPGTLLLNAGRGAVIDNRALVESLALRGDLLVALDVWETEPTIDRALLELVAIATPHIAGHSVEGKMRGTEMIFERFLAWRGELDKPHKVIFEQTEELAIEAVANPINAAILASYDVSEDDQRFRESMHRSANTAHNFDRLRREYPVRHQFSHFLCPDARDCQRDLKSLGFVT